MEVIYNCGEENWSAVVCTKQPIRNRMMYYVKHDYLIGQHLDKDLYWEDWLLPFIQEFYIPNTNMIDVGANIGATALLMEEVMSSGNTMYCFEPVYHQILSKNIETNITTENRMIVYPFGVSDTHDKVIDVGLYKWTIDKNFGATALDPELAPSHAFGPEIHQIQLKTLDSYDFKNIGFIKIDVEGMEEHVLRGARQLIEREQPVVLIEIWKRTFDKFINSEIGLWLRTIDYYILKVPSALDEDYLLVPNSKFPYSQRH
jgi:FkbM family methyltransferase